jgi:hypothetical protein
MFVHVVHFWLRPDLSAAERQLFDAGIKALAELPMVRFGHVGTPASTDRPVIDRSYSAALVVAFDDQGGHDAYQEHAVHDRFRRECAKLWERVLIRDSVG